MAPAVDTSRPDTRRFALKVTLLLVLAIVGAVACRYTPLQSWLEPAGRAAAWVRGAGWWGTTAFVLGSALLILLGVPRLLLCPVAGALFGFWGGTVASLISSQAAYQTAFVWLRYRGTRPDTVANRLPASLAWLRRDPGWVGVIVARLLPLHGMVITLGLALSSVSGPAYFIGSLIGLTPEAVPLVLLGAGLVPEGESGWLAWTLALGMLVVALGLGVYYSAVRLRRRSTP